MNDHNTRVLVIGLRSDEQEEVRLWCGRNDCPVWFAMNGLEALRVFEEVKPSTVVIDTILEDIDTERLARIFRSTSTAITMVFVAGHSAEAQYYGGLRDLDPARYCHRPIDPELIFDRARPVGTLGATADRGAVEPDRLGALMLEVLRIETSGVLYVGVGAFRKVIYFRDGRPHYATSTVLEENLGQFLLRVGEISQVEFNWARNLQLREGIRQGEALVKIGVLDHDRLTALLNAQIAEKIVNAFALRGVPFHFDRYDAAVLMPVHAYNTFELVAAGLEVGGFAARGPTTGRAVVCLDEHAAPRVVEELREYAGEALVGALAAGVAVGELEAIAPEHVSVAGLLHVLRLAGVVHDHASAVLSGQDLIDYPTLRTLATSHGATSAAVAAV